MNQLEKIINHLIGKFKLSRKTIFLWSKCIVNMLQTQKCRSGPVFFIHALSLFALFKKTLSRFPATKGLPATALFAPSLTSPAHCWQTCFPIGSVVQELLSYWSNSQATARRMVGKLSYWSNSPACFPIGSVMFDLLSYWSNSPACFPIGSVMFDFLSYWSNSPACFLLAHTCFLIGPTYQ